MEEGERGPLEAKKLHLEILKLEQDIAEKRLAAELTSEGLKKIRRENQSPWSSYLPALVALLAAILSFTGLAVTTIITQHETDRRLIADVDQRFLVDQIKGFRSWTQDWNAVRVAAEALARRRETLTDTMSGLESPISRPLALVLLERLYRTDLDLREGIAFSLQYYGPQSDGLAKMIFRDPTERPLCRAMAYLALGGDPLSDASLPYSVAEALARTFLPYPNKRSAEILHQRNKSMGLYGSSPADATLLNSCTAPELLMRIAKGDDEDSRTTVAANPSLTEEIASALLQGNHEDDDVPLILASNPRATRAILRKLVDISDNEVAEAIAKNPQSTPEVLETLFARKDSEILKALASHANTPGAILAQLAHHQDSSIRLFVARNPSADQATLKGLTDDEDRDVRASAIANPHLPDELILKWSASNESYLLGPNPNAPVRVLRALALNAGWSLIHNPNLPEDVAISIALKSDAETIWMLAGRTGLTPALQRAILERIRSMTPGHDRREASQRLAANPSTLGEILAAIPDPDWSTAEGIAANPNVLPETLEKMASRVDDMGPSLKEFVASSPRTPVAVLKRLARESPALYGCRVVENLGVSVDALLELSSWAQIGNLECTRRMVVLRTVTPTAPDATFCASPGGE